MFTQIEWQAHLERHNDLLREAKNHWHRPMVSSADRSQKQKSVLKPQNSKEQSSVCCSTSVI